MAKQTTMTDTLQEASIAGITQVGVALGTTASSLVSGKYDIDRIRLCGETFVDVDIEFNQINKGRSFIAGLFHKNAGASMS